MARSLILDSRVESAANAPLELWANDDTSIVVTDLSAPAPPLDTATSGSIDTEGDAIAARRHQNRQVSLTLEVTEPTDAAATNLVTNPSFEVDTAGWAITAGGFTAAATSLTQQAGGCAGNYSGRMVSSGTANSGVKTTLSGTFASGTTYKVRLRVRAVSGTPQVNLAIGLSGTDEAHSSNTTVNASTWTDVTASWTPSANRTSVILALVSVAASVITVDLDAAQVVAESALSTYFDGDTPGCAWSGTPGASASTRPAPGGARFDAILNDLSGKVAKLAAEGGTLRFCDAEGNPRTLDVLAAQSYEPQFDVKYFLANAATVAVSFMAKPYARGALVTLSTHHELALPALTFTETGIQGDVPALGELSIGAGLEQDWLVWGLRSRDYVNGEALFYEAETLPSLPSGTTVAGVLHASGGDVARRSPTTTWGTVATLATGLVGTFRVFARVQTVAASAYMRITWAPYALTSYGASAPVPNPRASVGDQVTGAFRNVDLGPITLATNPVTGLPNGAIINFEITAPVTTSAIGLDCIWLVPDDASGQASKVSGIPAVAPSPGGALLRYDGYFTYDGSGTGNPNVDKYIGDLLLVPTAGAEHRTVQFIVRPARGIDEDQFDSISATLSYTPRYLGLL